MKTNTLLKVGVLAALLTLAGLLAGCPMDAPPNELLGGWGVETAGIKMTTYKFQEGGIYSGLGIKLYDAKYTLTEIITFDGETRVGAAKYSISKNILTIQNNDAGLTSGSYVRM